PCGVTVIPIGAVLSYRKTIGKRLADADSRIAHTRHAIHSKRQDQAMRVNGCLFLGGLVGQANHRFLALAQTHQRTGDCAIDRNCRSPPAADLDLLLADEKIDRISAQITLPPQTRVGWQNGAETGEESGSRRAFHESASAQMRRVEVHLRPFERCLVFLDFTAPRADEPVHRSLLFLRNGISRQSHIGFPQLRNGAVIGSTISERIVRRRPRMRALARNRAKNRNSAPIRRTNSPELTRPMYETRPGSSCTTAFAGENSTAATRPEKTLPFGVDNSTNTSLGRSLPLRDLTFAVFTRDSSIAASGKRATHPHGKTARFFGFSGRSDCLTMPLCAARSRAIRGRRFACELFEGPVEL